MLLLVKQTEMGLTDRELRIMLDEVESRLGIDYSVRCLLDSAALLLATS